MASAPKDAPRYPYVVFSETEEGDWDDMKEMTSADAAVQEARSRAEAGGRHAIFECTQIYGQVSETKLLYSRRG